MKDKNYVEYEEEDVIDLTGFFGVGYEDDCDESGPIYVNEKFWCDKPTADLYINGYLID